MFRFMSSRSDVPTCAGRRWGERVLGVEVGAPCVRTTVPGPGLRAGPMRLGPADQAVSSEPDAPGTLLGSLPPGSRPWSRIRLAAARNGSEVALSVSDDGPGIPPDNLETVFERFYTSRPKGAVFGSNSGLGLSIVRQIVEAHGGHVHAENKTEGGARFEIVFPSVGRWS